MKIKITRVDKTLPLPEYQTPGAVGFDLYARVKTMVKPKSLARIPSNIIVQTPRNYVFLLAARSSLAFKKGLMLANGVGIIDHDFSGPEDEVQIAVYNFTNQTVVVDRGERIAQGLFIPTAIAAWQEIGATAKKTRGGFGSTGNK